MTAQLDSTPRLVIPTPIVALAGLAALGVLWSYWTTLAEIVWRWSKDPQYSHGYLVPGFALYLLWQRRRLAAGHAGRDADAWLGLACSARPPWSASAGAYFHFGYFDQVSLLPCSAGLFVLAGAGRGLGLVVARDRVPGVHGAVAAHLVAGPVRPDARIAHGGSTFLAASAGPAGALPRETSSCSTNRAGHRRGVQRPAHAGGVLRTVDRGRDAHPQAALGKAGRGRQRHSDRACRPTSCASPSRDCCARLSATAAGCKKFDEVVGYFMMPMGLMFLGLEWFVLGKLLVEPTSIGRCRARSPCSGSRSTRRPCTAAPVRRGAAAATSRCRPQCRQRRRRRPSRRRCRSSSHDYAARASAWAFVFQL